MLKLNQTERILQRFAKKLQFNMIKGEEALKRPLPQGLRAMASILEPGQSGKVRIENYEVSQMNAQLFNIEHALSSTQEMSITPGRYTRLIVNGEVMMSDAPYEAQSNRDIIEKAEGDVLIAGLGMGMVLIPILLKKSVRSVYIIEKNRDVIRLVWPHIRNWREDEVLKGSKPAPLKLETGDIFTWEPVPVRDPSKEKPQKFDVIYFDIWPTIAKKNLVEGAALKKRFKKYLKPGGWMGVWVEKEMRARVAKEAKMDARRRVKSDSERKASSS